MHIEGFNIHALEGAIHIARSILFVAVAAIWIDKTNIFLTSTTICIVLTMRRSMSNAMRIAVYNIATMCASMHITPINMYEDPYVARSWAQYMFTMIILLSLIPSIRIVMLYVLLWTIRIEWPSLNYYNS